MKKISFVIMLLLLVLSCSNNIDELSGNYSEYTVTLESGRELNLKAENNKAIKNESYYQLQTFLAKNKNYSVLDLGKNQYRLFSDVEKSKKYVAEEFFKSNLSNSKNNNNKSLINGRAIFYDGFDLTGLQSDVRVDAGDKEMWQIPSFLIAKSKYHDDGSTESPIVDLDNKISSLQLTNDVMVIFYSEKFFNLNAPNGRTFGYANRRDLNDSNGTVRNINLYNNPLYELFGIGFPSQNNTPSSALITCRVAPE